MFRDKEVCTWKSGLYTLLFYVPKLHNEIGKVNLNALGIYSEITFRYEKKLSPQKKIKEPSELGENLRNL